MGVPFAIIVVNLARISSRPCSFARNPFKAVSTSSEDARTRRRKSGRIGSDVAKCRISRVDLFAFPASAGVRHQSWLGTAEDGRRPSQWPQREGIHADAARGPRGDQRQLQVRGFGQDQVGQDGLAALGEDFHG